MNMAYIEQIEQYIDLRMVPVSDPRHDDGLQVLHDVPPVLRLLRGRGGHQLGEVAGADPRQHRPRPDVVQVVRHVVDHRSPELTELLARCHPPTLEL